MGVIDAGGEVSRRARVAARASDQVAPPEEVPGTSILPVRLEARRPGRAELLALEEDGAVGRGEGGALVGVEDGGAFG